MAKGLGRWVVLAGWLGFSGLAMARDAPQADQALREARAQIRAGRYEEALASTQRGLVAAHSSSSASASTHADLLSTRAGLLHRLGHGDGEVFLACAEAARIDPLSRPPVALEGDALRTICERARVAGRRVHRCGSSARWPGSTFKRPAAWR